MRGGLLVIGVVFLVLGSVLVWVPLIPQSSTFNATTGASSATATNYTIFQASPALFGGTAAKLTWTSNATVTLGVVTCTKAITTSELSSAKTPAEFNADCGTNATYGSTTDDGVSFSTGTGGSLTFTIPASGSLIFYAGSEKPASVSVTLTTSEPLGGTIVLLLGVLLLIFGIALKSKKAKRSQMAPYAAGGQGAPGAPGSPASPGAAPVQAWQPPPPSPPPPPPPS